MRSMRAKTPVVIQMEAVECGAAALGIILGYYRKFIPLEELRLECGVSRDGSKANNMLRAARKYGFEAKGFRKELKELKDIKTPFIVFWNFNHFLVVEGFKGDKVYLNDPASGHRTVTMKEFDYGFTGVVLTFEPSKEFQPSGKKPNLFSVFYSRFKGAEIALIFLLLTGVALAIPNLLVPIFTKIFIDKYLIANLTSWIFPLLLGMAITAVFRGLLTYMQEYFLIKLETKLAIVLSAKFFWHVLQLPIAFFSQRSPGDVSSRVGLNDGVAIALSRRVMSAILSMILAVFYLSLMFYYDLILTIVVLISAACIVVVSEYLNRKRKDLSQSMISDQSKFMGTSMDGLLVIETLKSSGRESDFFARWSGYQAKFVNTQQKNAAFTYMVTVIPLLLNGINTALILGVGGFQVISGSITIGMLVAFQSLSSSFITPIQDVVSASGEFNDLYGTITRLDDVLNYKKMPNISIAPSTEEIEDTSRTPKLEGYIELRNISFGYSPLDPPLIEDFSLKLAPGHRIALVGGTGSGKSTVAKLVVGLYMPWEGEILFDGKPFEKIPRTIITNSLSMVDQNISMFAGTVRDNITLWDSSIEEQNIIQAAKDACIHDDIVARENGYDGLVYEGGTNFSGGQRQRLEIARSLLTAPRILVLDEATSALDPITELSIDHSVRRRGCTAIIVAHRLSTIRDADEIIVLDKGKVVERGTHDSLYEQQGLYSKLIKAT